MSGAMRWLGFGGSPGGVAPFQGVQVQTSVSTVGIPIVYGQTRLPPNLIWYGNFQQTSSGGGKGGGGGKGSGGSYSASVAMGICEGPVETIIGVWINGSYQSVATAGLTVFTGTATQAPWSYLTTNYPSQARAYPNTCYAAAPNYSLGSSAELPNHNYEVAGFLQFTSGAGTTMAANLPTIWTATTAYTVGNVVYGTAGGTFVCTAANTNEQPPNATYWTEIFPDCNPALVLQDLLTNTSYGVGMPSALLGDWTAYTAYCTANTLLISLTVNQQEAASSIAQRIMEITNSEMFWSDGLLKIVPRGDLTVTGNGATFTPDLTPIFNLTDDQFIANSQDDPVSLAISDQVDAFNCVTVNYTNRINDYNTVPIQVKDQTSIDLYGIRNESPQQHVEICDPLIAQTSAQLRLQRLQSTRNVYTWNLSLLFCMLEPMDLVTLTDSALGVEDALVRITSIEEDEYGNLKFTGEEVMIGAAQPAEFNIGTSLGYTANYNETPANTNAPIVFMPPTQLSSNTTALWLLASGVGNWGGCEVWVSGDGSTYAYQGKITTASTQGVLAGSLAATADPDTTDTLAVNLSESAGTLISVSQADADANRSLCYVDGELISYETATLTGAGAYSLTYLRRGQYGTAVAAHAAGAPFGALRSNVFSLPVTADQLGTGIWVKLPALNVYGGGLQDLSTATAYPVLFSALPTPSGLTATGGLFMIDLSWQVTTTRTDIEYVEIWGSQSDSRSSAVLLTTVPWPNNTWQHNGLQPGVSWFYWARVVDMAADHGAFFPTSATAGVQGAPSADSSTLLTQLEGAVGLAQLASALATPIGQIPAIQIAVDQIPAIQTTVDQIPAIQGSVQGLAKADLAKSLLTDSLASQALFQGAVNNATISVDPTTGDISLVATANVSTDIEQAITQLTADYNAINGSITSTVSTVSTMQGNLTSAQSQITQLANAVNLSATQVYVDSSVANATGALTVEAANAAQALATAALQGALTADAANLSALVNAANVAAANTQITANANAISAQASQITTLFSNVGTNSAGLAAEAITRANADTSLSEQITSLTATVTTNAATAAANLATQASTSAAATTAVSTLITNLTATVTSNNTSQTASLATESSTRASADTALSDQLTTLTSTVTANNTAQSASLASEATTRANADSALSSEISSLTATVTANNSTSTAGLATEVSTRATADSALSAQISNLSGTVTTNASTIAANLATEASTRATADTALSAEIATLSSTVTTNASTAAANLATEASTRSSADSALSTSISQLSATVTANNNTLTSQIQSVSTTTTTATNANASAITSLQSSLSSTNSTVSGLSSSLATVQTQATTTADTVAGLAANYTIQVQAGGYVSGIELAAGGGSSSFIVLADNFLVAQPSAGATPQQVFIVGDVGGVTAVGINGALIVNGSIVGNAVIASGSITAAQMSTGTITAASGVLASASVGTLTIAGNSVTVPVGAYYSGAVYTGAGYNTNLIAAYVNRSNGAGGAVPMTGIISYTHQNNGSSFYGDAHTVAVQVVRSADGATVFWGTFSASGAWTTPYSATFQDSYSGPTWYTLQYYITSGSANAYYSAMTLIETRR